MLKHVPICAYNRYCCLQPPHPERENATSPVLKAPSSCGHLLRPHWRRSSLFFFFAQNCLFILHFPCVLRAVSESLSLRELRTQSWNEEAPRETRVGARHEFSAAQIRSRILPETGTNFVPTSVPSSPRIFQPFFPCPRKNPRRIHATFGAKLGNIFPNGFSGCPTLVCVAAIGCQHFYADPPRLVS